MTGGTEEQKLEAGTPPGSIILGELGPPNPFETPPNATIPVFGPQTREQVERASEATATILEQQVKDLLSRDDASLREEVEFVDSSGNQTNRANDPSYLSSGRPPGTQPYWNFIRRFFDHETDREQHVIASLEREFMDTWDSFKALDQEDLSLIHI